MKNSVIAVLFATLFSGNGIAHAADLVAQLSNIDANIQNITLDSDGVLAATFWENNCVVKQSFSPANQMRYTYLAEVLGTAKTITKKFTHCPPHFIDPRYAFELSVRDKSPTGGGKMKIVLTMNDCSLPSFTHPKESELETDSRLLKEVLWAFANEIKCPTL